LTTAPHCSASFETVWFAGQMTWQGALIVTVNEQLARLPAPSL
jgi:hypothetical protein